jgi:hypothetical protein
MNDPVIDEIRRVRRVISNEIGPDLSRMVEYYARAESQFKRPPITKGNRRTKHCIEVADQPLPDGGSTPATR